MMKCFNTLVALVKGCPLIVVLAWAVACTPVERVTPTATAVTIARVITPMPATRTPPPAPTATQPPPLPTVTPTAITSPSITPTTSPSNTPSPTPDFTCPQPDTPALFAQPANIAELQEQILTYLNAGGQVGDLANLVASLDIDGDMVTVDLNGDGALELIANFGVISKQSYPLPEYATWIFQCQTDTYKNIFTVWLEPYTFYDSVIQDDLNNDGIFELIILGGFAGSSCAMLPSLLRWENGEVVRYFPSAPPQPPIGCSADNRVILRDLNNDDFKELMVSGRSSTFLTSGPARVITHTFSLHDQYELISTDYAPAQYRVHVLDDAQRALDANDISLAAQLYTQAAYDDTLEDYSSHLLPPHPMALESNSTKQDFPNEYQRAFAFFRLAALQALSGDEVGVSNTLAQLQETFPEGAPGNEFVVLTPILTTSLLQGRTPSLACGQVLTHIRANFPDLEAHYYWGRNIAWYQNETICPFTTP